MCQGPGSTTSLRVMNIISPEDIPPFIRFDDGVGEHHVG